MSSVGYNGGALVFLWAYLMIYMIKKILLGHLLQLINVLTMTKLYTYSTQFYTCT